MRTAMKKFQCIVCGFIYDEAEGLPEEGIAPGTHWDDIPSDWECPECGVGKADFEMVEMSPFTGPRRTAQSILEGLPVYPVTESGPGSTVSPNSNQS
jgi:rubredoxin